VIVPDRYDSDTPEYLRISRVFLKRGKQQIYTMTAIASRRGKGKTADLIKSSGKKILALRHEGLSYNKISKVYKVSAFTIRAVIQELGGIL